MINDLSYKKKKYAISKHHAWAGSILLAILLAIRIFFETMDIKEYDELFVIIGLFIIIYVLISLIFAYKYRLGLYSDEKSINFMISSNNSDNNKIKEKYDKNFAKIQKKKSKERLKELKKSK